MRDTRLVKQSGSGADSMHGSHLVHSSALFCGQKYEICNMQELTSGCSRQAKPKKLPQGLELAMLLWAHLRTQIKATCKPTPAALLPDLVSGFPPACSDSLSANSPTPCMSCRALSAALVDAPER